MKLEGIHHVTAITAEAQRNVDFYAGLLGLRFVKKSVNQDDTSVYRRDGEPCCPRDWISFSRSGTGPISEDACREP